MGMTTRTGICWLLLTALALGRAGASEPIRVQNGPRPSQTIRNWHLKELWRVGNEEDDFFFGRIVDVASDAAGRSYVLDYQQQETYVFDRAGKFLGLRGGRGEGPGETTMASKLLVGPERLGLLNRYPAEIVWLDADGDPAGSVTPRYEPNPEAIIGCWWGRLRADRIFWALTVSTFGEGEVSSSYHLAECDSSGGIHSIYLTLGEDVYTHGIQDGMVDEGRYFNPLEGRWDVDRLGRVWVAPYRDRYLLRVLDAEGQTVMETGREYAPPVRSAEDVRKIKRSLEDRWNRTGEPVEVGMRAPSIGKLWIATNPWGDEIWIESGASHFELPPGVMVRYDIFDLEGNFTHQVDIVGDGNSLFDHWYLVGSDRLVMVRNASSGGYQEGDPAHPRLDDDLLEVIGYQILWEE